MRLLLSAPRDHGHEKDKFVSGYEWLQTDTDAYKGEVGTSGKLTALTVS